MSTLLEVCQTVVTGVNGAWRCAIVHLEEEETLADILSLRNTSKIERNVMEGVAQALRSQVFTSANRTLKQRDGTLNTNQKLVQFSTADCLRFGITTQDGKVALILITGSSASPAACWAKLHEGIVRLERMATLARKGDLPRTG